MQKMPAWVDVVVIPLISLVIAFAISGIVILAIGENPIDAVRVMITGALGSSYGWGFTLYYATNFMFTGLAFAVAFHAGLFNIGGEGQAMLYSYKPLTEVPMDIPGVPFGRVPPNYLRDNMTHSPEELVQRKHNYAIVDEVDSVL